eukprot:3506155-Rhodomonas_salina.3
MEPSPSRSAVPQWGCRWDTLRQPSHVRNALAGQPMFQQVQPAAMQYQMPMQQPQMQFVQQQPQMQFIQQAPPPPQYQIMSAPGPIMGMGGLPCLLYTSDAADDM